MSTTRLICNSSLFLKMNYVPHIVKHQKCNLGGCISQYGQERMGIGTPFLHYTWLKASCIEKMTHFTDIFIHQLVQEHRGQTRSERSPSSCYTGQEPASALVLIGRFQIYGSFQGCCCPGTRLAAYPDSLHLCKLIRSLTIAISVRTSRTISISSSLRSVGRRRNVHQ